MTIAMAWVAQRSDGRRYLYFASDSRTRGGNVIDCCPKVLTLPRSDCAICFAGNTAATYPLMMQLANAIDAHQPARDRSLDIHTLRPHLLRVFSDIMGGITDSSDPITASDVQFLFGGYSWLSKSLELWTIYYSGKEKKFAARHAVSFHPLLRQIAFVGDRAKDARAEVVSRLNKIDAKNIPKRFDLLPLTVLRDMLRQSSSSDSIGGPPQLVRIAEHMNTRVFAIKWPNAESKAVTLMGRRIFDYENTDNWVLDPDTLNVTRPRSFGHREDDEGSCEPP